MQKSKLTNPQFDPNSENKINELWFQYLWNSKIFQKETLLTTQDQPLTIIFPGWFNKSWGPDFTDARIKIGQEEYFGDIEIHINESDWFQHGHSLNASYNRVILHVFFKKSETQARNTFKQIIPSFCLDSPSLKTFWNKLTTDSNTQLKEVPGACGLSFSDNSFPLIKSIIQQSAENRMMTKSIPFKSTLQNKEFLEKENILYASIVKSIGYSAYSENFLKVAQRFPYSNLKAFFKSSHRQSRVEILSRWFGYLGLLDQYDVKDFHEEARREWRSFQQKWKTIGEANLTDRERIRFPVRPLNNPIRRLIGLYYHVEQTQFNGLVKSWLQFLHECGALIPQQKNKVKILTRLNQMFTQSSWDSFAFFNSKNLNGESQQKTKFVGQQRQLIIMSNSIIPFFLAWANLNSDKDLEKTLFRLLLILPNEGDNKKTRFMENRFSIQGKIPKKNKNLGYHQGLIQLYDDSCTSFYEGCKNCSLLKWMDSV